MDTNEHELFFTKKPICISSWFSGVEWLRKDKNKMKSEIFIIILLSCQKWGFSLINRIKTVNAYKNCDWC